MTRKRNAQPVQENVRRPLGLAAFESLRAEDEPWLAERAYILPPDFELMAGARSIVVYGWPGSGKTALRRALEHRAASITPARLIVHWRPGLPEDVAIAGTLAARAQLAQVMDACAAALLKHLACAYTSYGQAPEWAQQTLGWFIQRYARSDLTIRVAPLLSRADDVGQAFLRKLVTEPARNVLAADASFDAVVARLIEALNTIGIGGVWVMADGVESLAEAEPDRLTAALTAFLSSLAYFEQAPFFYKLVLPLSLQPQLDTAGGVARWRVFPHQLHWTSEALKRMVERRLALAVGADDFKITDFYVPPAKKSEPQRPDQASEPDQPGRGAKRKPAEQPKPHPVQAWLAGCGGVTPRGWLTFAGPLAAAYLQLQRQGESRPLTHAEWLEARRRVPLYLSLDEASGLVKVGWRTIERLSPLELSVLKYLIAHQGRICSKEELYENAYLAPSGQAGSQASPEKAGQSDSPAVGQRKGSTSGYANVMDTVLWRLREVIEPDMDDPVFLVTHRGQGVVLYLQPFQ